MHSIADNDFARAVEIKRVNFQKHDERPIYRQLTHKASGIVIDGGPNEVAASLVKRLMERLPNGS